MIFGYVIDGDRLKSVEDPLGQFYDLIWIDLLEPTSEEEAALESRLSLDLPTREDMAEIEVSARLYRESGAAYMTATSVAYADGPNPETVPITFILHERRLITVRYHSPRAFETFPKHAQRANLGCIDGTTVLLALLEAMVERLADIAEREAKSIDSLSRQIFRPKSDAMRKGRDYRRMLESIGQVGDMTSLLLDSLVTLDRVSAYMVFVSAKGQAETKRRLKSLSRDIRSLSEHSSFLSQKSTFLLEATLGMINIEQNAIIKIFSVAAVIFLPPTLVASIYGMNFQLMPELSWPFGYPFAIGVMVCSAIIPYLFFKRKGWL